VPAPGGEVDGERVVILVESALTEAAQKEQLAKAIRETITRAFGLAVEAQVVAPWSVPKTTSGKVRRNQCRTDYLNSAHEQAPVEAAS
jgi:acyl-CoA synthetase (AMP-forming)/AMP-acid ligase II